MYSEVNYEKVNMIDTKYLKIEIVMIIHQKK